MNNDDLAATKRELDNAASTIHDVAGPLKDIRDVLERGADAIRTMESRNCTVQAQVHRALRDLGVGVLPSSDTGALIDKLAGYAKEKIYSLQEALDVPSDEVKLLNDANAKLNAAIAKCDQTAQRDATEITCLGTNLGYAQEHAVRQNKNVAELYARCRVSEAASEALTAQVGELQALNSQLEEQNVILAERVQGAIDSHCNDAAVYQEEIARRDEAASKIKHVYDKRIATLEGQLADLKKRETNADLQQAAESLLSRIDVDGWEPSPEGSCGPPGVRADQDRLGQRAPRHRNGESVGAVVIGLVQAQGHFRSMSLQLRQAQGDSAAMRKEIATLRGRLVNYAESDRVTEFLETKYGKFEDVAKCYKALDATFLFHYGAASKLDDISRWIEQIHPRVNCFQSELFKVREDLTRFKRVNIEQLQGFDARGTSLERHIESYRRVLGIISESINVKAIGVETYGDQWAHNVVDRLRDKARAELRQEHKRELEPLAIKASKYDAIQDILGST